MNYVHHFAREYLKLALSDPRHGLHPGAVNDVIELALSRLDANVGEPGWKSVASEHCVADETGAERGDIGFWLHDLKQHSPLYFLDAPADDGTWTEEKLARLDPHVRTMVEANLARQQAQQEAGGSVEMSGMTPVQKMNLARGGYVPAPTKPALSDLSPVEKMNAARRAQQPETTDKPHPAYQAWKSRQGQ